MSFASNKNFARRSNWHEVGVRKIMADICTKTGIGIKRKN